MIYGITGHQERDGIDWDWVRLAIGEELGRGGAPLRGLSSLARGADQVFAEEVLRLCGELTAIIPIEAYETYFEGDALANYRRLLAGSTVERMPAVDDDEAAFLAAGIRVADRCEVLLAVWDGEGAHGSGGTADIVAHARAIGRSVVQLQPISREISRF
jgi:hypothetical protein